MVFPQTETLEASSGETFHSVGFLIALIMWSFGLVWLFFALASIARCKSFPFNIGWWGFTFPLGVFAVCTCEMGSALPSRFFRILGTVRVLSPTFSDKSKNRQSQFKVAHLVVAALTSVAGSVAVCARSVGRGQRGHVEGRLVWSLVFRALSAAGQGGGNGR